MAKKLELTPRLQLLADWVPQGTRLADIGTDHGHLPVWLSLQGRIVSAVASDLRKGPMERAKENGRTYGAQNIDYRLGNGLGEISSEEVDVIVIAGMGGETICSILEEAPWTADGEHTLLLSPHTKAEELRRYLMEHGFEIRREALVYDRGTIYPVMEVVAGRMELSLGQLWGGAKLAKDPLGDQYMIEKMIRLFGAVAGLNRSDRPADLEKANHLRDILTELIFMREEWRHANRPRN